MGCQKIGLRHTFKLEEDWNSVFLELGCDTRTGEKMGHWASKIVIQVGKCYKYENGTESVVS